MPCWTVQQFGVRLKAADKDILEAALREEFGAVVKASDGSLRFHVNGVEVTVRDGEVRTYAGEAATRDMAGRINRAYSREVVKRAASRFGWSLKQDAPDKYRAVRRA